MMRIAHNGRKIAMYLPDVVTLEEPRILIIFACRAGIQSFLLNRA